MGKMATVYYVCLFCVSFIGFVAILLHMKGAVSIERWNVFSFVFRGGIKVNRGEKDKTIIRFFPFKNF